MKKTFATLLFVSSFVTAFAYDGQEKDSTGCPKAFQGRCHCGMQRYKYWKPDQEIYMVNCTNTNFKDTYMLELLPEETEVLIFVGNIIPQMDWNVFGIWDEHKNLHVVDLTNNRIQGILGKTFHKVGHVKRLVLNHNDLIVSGRGLHPRIFSNFYELEELHLTNTFTETIDSRWYLSDLKEIFLSSNMTKLRKLHLEQNEIWEIKDEDMFCDLKGLEELHLGDNQMQSIDFSIDCLEQLSYLNLEYNKIRRLDSNTLQKIDKVFASEKAKKKRSMINLKGNPFICDCHLKTFQNWLRTTETTLFRKDELFCFEGTPVENAGKLIENVELLECPNAISDERIPGARSRQITHVLLVILIICVLCVGGILMYQNREKLNKNVKPLMESFQRSFQYRTINKDDETPVAEVNV